MWQKKVFLFLVICIKFGIRVCWNSNVSWLIKHGYTYVHLRGSWNLEISKINAIWGPWKCYDIAAGHLPSNDFFFVRINCLSDPFGLSDHLSITVLPNKFVRNPKPRVRSSKRATKDLVAWLVLVVISWSSHGTLQWVKMSHAMISWLQLRRSLIMVLTQSCLWDQLKFTKQTGPG